MNQTLETIYINFPFRGCMLCFGPTIIQQSAIYDVLYNNVYVSFNCCVIRQHIEVANGY